MVRKRKDGYYAATCRVEGKKKFFYAATRREAVAKRDMYLARVKQYPDLDKHITLSEWCSAWLETIASDVSPKTHESYTTVLKHITERPIGGPPPGPFPHVLAGYAGIRIVSPHGGLLPHGHQHCIKAGGTGWRHSVQSPGRRKEAPCPSHQGHGSDP